LLADGLRTAPLLPPFDQYQLIAIVAHSMGGLVVQRELVDDDQLAGRSNHVFMFGVPSASLDEVDAPMGYGFLQVDDAIDWRADAVVPAIANLLNRISQTLPKRVGRSCYMSQSTPLQAN
jgi:alpha-beta hydrolase superfamily lysophospholipase